MITHLVVFQTVRNTVQRLRIGCTVKAIAPVVLLSAKLLAQAGSPCPLTLISGEGDLSGITISFNNAGKEPIRRVEFGCAAKRNHKGTPHTNRAGICRENNAMFFPATPYELKYPYPGGVPAPVVVSVKSVTLSDGYIWKPSKYQKCRTLRIVPKHLR